MEICKRKYLSKGSCQISLLKYPPILPSIIQSHRLTLGAVIVECMVQKSMTEFWAVSKTDCLLLRVYIKTGHGTLWLNPVLLRGVVFGDPTQPHHPLTQSPVSPHLHLFVGVHKHAACYKRRQRDCIIVPLLKLCNHLFSEHFWFIDEKQGSLVWTCVDMHLFQYFK